MKKIIYIGNFSFPLGNAAGKRVYANGKLFRDLGYEVVYLGIDKKIQQNIVLEKTENEFDGFKFYNFPYPKNSGEWISYNNTFKSFVKLVDNKIDIKTVEMIVYYGTPSLSLFINKLIKYCKKNNIIIISDCVDWLSVRTNNPLFNIIKWIDNTYQKTYLNKKVDGVIAISKFLEEYYKKSSLKTVIIPPLSPFEINSINLNKNNYKLIVYAGIPFRKGIIIKDANTLKDRIDKTIYLLYKVKEQGAQFRFDIYGFTENEYLEVLPSQRKYVKNLGDSIVFHGMRTNDEVTKKISNADFMIFIRDVNRATTAGFPTKFSESISYGTPVITTRTSDLESYLFENKNGFFININNEKEAINSLLNILKLSKEEIFSMKRYCMEKDLFYYKKFKFNMSKFINDFG